MLLLCDTYLSGIWEDKLIPYYSEVDKWSNIYLYQIGLGGSYNHGFKPVKLPGVFFHYGCIVRYCVWGGTSGRLVPYFGGRLLDTDPDFGQYRHF